MMTLSSFFSTLILDTINLFLIRYLFSSLFDKKAIKKLYLHGIVIGYIILDLFITQKSSKVLLDLIVFILLSFNYHMFTKDRFKVIVISVGLYCVSEYFVYQLLLNLFEYNMVIRGTMYNDLLTLFQMVLTRYVLYVILYIVLYKKSLIDDVKSKLFKVISLLVSFFYGITIVIFFDELLFYHHTVGNIFVFTLILYNIILIVFNCYERMHLRTLHELDTMKNNRSFQEKYWNDYMASSQQIRKSKHDMLNNYIGLYGLLNEGKYDEVKASIESKICHLKDMETVIYLNNPRIDAILSKKKSDAALHHIQMRYHIGLVRLGYIDDEDLGILLANALDNAIEATVKSNNDVIDVDIFTNKSYLCIKVMNYVEDINSVHFYKTSKIDDVLNHGIGIRSMRECAKKYNGYLEYRKEDDRVILIVNLYIE